MKAIFLSIFILVIFVQKSSSQNNNSRTPRRCVRRGTDGSEGGGGGGDGGDGDGLPSECHMNGSGFICCSDALEDTIMEAIDDLKTQKTGQGEFFSSCNIHGMAKKIGEMAEKRFNTSMETIVGITNFASRTRFSGNLICKVKAEGKFILAYGTPKKFNPLDNIPLPSPFKRRHHTFTYRL